jgi:hypothetical protein
MDMIKLTGLWKNEGPMGGVCNFLQTRFIRVPGRGR